MCGISGFMDLSGRRRSEELEEMVRRMAAELIQRGLQSNRFQSGRVVAVCLVRLF